MKGMARTSTREKTSAQLKVAMVIPSEKKCGISTYSHFLSDELKKIPTISTHLVENVCNNDIFSYAAFARRLESEADVIHIQYEFGRFGKVGISGVATPFFYRSFNSPRKIITTLHELPQSKNPLVYFFQKMFLGIIVEKSGTVIVHTHQMHDFLRTAFPTHAEKIMMIPHGMYIPPFTKKAPRPRELRGKKVIGFFGFLAPHKNVEAVIDALAQLPADYAALVAGEATDQNYAQLLHQRAVEKGVSSRIRWEGFVPEERMSDVFSWIDVVIFPYTRVTESGILHLALGRKKIVLTSKLPAFEEIESQYECISTFSDVNDLVQKIQSVIKSKKNRTVLLAGMEKFVRERNWKTIAHRHEEIYRKTSK